MQKYHESQELHNENLPKLKEGSLESFRKIYYHWRSIHRFYIYGLLTDFTATLENGTPWPPPHLTEEQKSETWDLAGKLMNDFYTKFWETKVYQKIPVEYNAYKYYIYKKIRVYLRSQGYLKNTLVKKKLRSITSILQKKLLQIFRSFWK